MRRLTCHFSQLSFCFLLGVVSAQSPPAAMETIQSEELMRHASYLASEELGGRLTGSIGQQAAAKYISAHFEKLGLEPLGDKLADGSGRSFLQHYGITRRYLGDETSLKFESVVLREGFAVLGDKEGDVALSGTLHLCGFGRTRGSNRDIDEGEDLKGKVAVVAIKAPRGRIDGTLSVEQKFGLSFGVLGRFGRTARSLAKVGAMAVLFVQVEDAIGLSDVLNTVAVSPGKAVVGPDFPGASAGMAGLGALARDGGVPTLVLSVGASRKLLDVLEVDHKQFEAFLAGDAECPASKLDVPIEMNMDVHYDEDVKASNVVAVLRGSDANLSSEAIVYSAHMDHVGRRMDGDVFNGADDNASGSAGLLAIAGAYANAKTKPRRSIIFLSVSGEELGLWGSQYYSDNATWQLDKIVANINTDMIGRSGPESGPLSVTVTPSYRHAKFSTIVRDSARFAGHLGMTFSSGDKYYTRSDHYNFARKGIPVVFFCNGEHEDYHQVSDHSDKLDPDKMQRIARLAFWTGWSVANADEAPRKLGRQKDWLGDK